MFDSKECKNDALQQLRGQWIKAVLVGLIFLLITSALDSITAEMRLLVLIRGKWDIISYKYYNWSIFNWIVAQGKYILHSGRFGLAPQNDWYTSKFIATLINLIFTGVLNFGVATFFLKLARNEEAEISDMFKGFRYFVKTFVLYLLYSIFVYIGTLLLVVPGIMLTLSYSMAYYIMNDNPELSGLDALKLSRKMMNGHKGELFYLELSFIGWFILGVLTAGVGLLWASAYFDATKANFYEKLKQSQVSELIKV